MPHQLVDRLEADDLPGLLEATHGLAKRVVDVEGVRHVGVARAEGAVLLFITFHGAADAGRICEALVDPWLATTQTTTHVRTLAEVTLDLSPTVPDADGPTRLAAFTVAATTAGAVWGLYGTTWARSTAAGETEALPVWPTRDQAARCMTGDWEDHVPRKIELGAYLDQWLTGMEEDGIVAVVHPTPGDPGVVMPPEELASLLRGSS